MKRHFKIFLIVLSFPTTVLSSFQSGIGVELNIGYPQMTAQLGGTAARYTGMALSGQLILPLLDYDKNFSVDLTAGYRLANYQNTASTGVVAEWAKLQGFTAGSRFNLKYFFLGAEMIFVDGQHVVGGTNSEVFNYNISPVQLYGGFNVPLSDMASLALSYNQYLTKGQATVSGYGISINEQTVYLSLQFDLGIGFFNVIEKDSTFKFLDDIEL